MKAYVNLLVFQGDKATLLDWCNGRHCCPADVIEDLIYEHLEKLEEKYPKDPDPDEDICTRWDLRYERNLDERMGM